MTIRPPGSPAPDPLLDAGLAAAFGPDDLTAGGWTRPPLLRDDPSDFSPVVRPDSAEMARADPGRYQLLGEIARGGMGVVLKGRDPDLGRDLAVKVLKQELAGKAAAEQRFVEEAQVGGQLQHPGVVPVYELGRFADGRPYFTMKLVKGRTLADLLAERPAPAHDLGHFLQVFGKVCDAVGYAHSRGVIHRDIKPANVMVGSFGEVQVMDWGLAKVLPRGGVADEEKARTAGEKTVAPAREEPTVIRTVRSGGSSDGSETEAGSMLGTPAFMPPEQAGGEIDKLDERADVFGLGAVLCVILTGKPPYVGESSEVVRLKAVRGQVADAFTRLDGCGAAPELVALCKRCLAPERDDRPRHAGEVATAVAGHLAGVEDRARRAEVERAAAASEAREQRKRRKVQLALAASVALLVVGAGAVGWWQDRRAADERARVARNQDALTELLERCESVLREENSPAARAALAEAERRLPDGGGADLADRLDRCRADVAILSELDWISQSYWASLLSLQDIRPALLASLQDIRPALLARCRGAFAGFGVDVGKTPPAEAARRIQASLVRDRLIEALDRWLQPDVPAVRDVLRAADPDPYRDAVRDAVMVPDLAKLAELAGRAEALTQPPWFAVTLGSRPVGAADRRRAILATALGSRPGNLPLLMQLGMSYFQVTNDRSLKGNVAERLRWFQAAVAAHPRSVAGLMFLAEALSDGGDLDGAVACYETAIRTDPTNGATHYFFGRHYMGQGDYEKAIPWFRESLRLDPTNLMRDTPYTYAIGMAGRPMEALRAISDAFERHPGLIDDPRNQLRYNAACFSLRCYEGKGTDVPPPADRGPYRKRAFDLLTADLAAFRKLSATDPATVYDYLRDWFTDEDLVSVREPAGQAKLPPDERAEWVKLWAEARDLLAATAPRETGPPPREDTGPAKK